MVAASNENKLFKKGEQEKNFTRFQLEEEQFIETKIRQNLSKLRTVKTQIHQSIL